MLDALVIPSRGISLIPENGTMRKSFSKKKLWCVGSLEFEY